MGKKAVSPFTRAQAVALYNNNKTPMSMNDVDKQLKVSKCCVYNAIKKHKEAGEFSDKKRSGRPQKIDERGQRHLKRLVKGENRLSVSKITKDWNQSQSKSVTRRTVFNYLKRLGYEYKVKLKKQWLSAKQRERRVAWCKRYVHFSKEDWHNVIFSDDSTFYVLQRKNQVKIWRTHEERLHQDCIQQVNTGNGGKVGIWEVFRVKEQQERRYSTKIWTDRLYCNILSGELKWSMAKLHDKVKIIYQQDLAPWHTSEIFKAKIDKMKLKVLDWPAKSPDLNPIEMVWSILDKKFMATPIYSKDTLRKRLDQEWKALGTELCRKLLDSMPDRLQKCLRAKGSHFC